MTYRQLESLLQDLTECKDTFESQEELIHELAERKAAFQSIRVKIRKHFRGLDQFQDFQDKKVKPILSEIKKHKFLTSYTDRIQTMIALSDSLRKIHLAMHPHELDNQHKQLDVIMD